MILARWRARRANRNRIDEIHGEIVAAARDPALFSACGAPDDLDGRFEVLSLYAGLVLRRVNALADLGPDMAQDLIDRVFSGLEDALREMGHSDAGVAKRMKAMAQAFYGRNQAYEAAIGAQDREALAAALVRNVYRAGTAGDPARADALASRVLAVAAALEALPSDLFTDGQFRFPLIPGGPT